ncbi:MAG: tRNA preQ1(34) S-adenosylmethionine ribosyltransferase-isomerase QueA [Epsilonproteobacteria bacterium]|nr:tRNA preQ1(34) S-adenosylmethionine ribosyltransferase-isomerase QueA [Campylobacterota bacterium]
MVDSYDYELPKELIASRPVTPADSAKLLVYDRRKDKITHAVFMDIDDFLPKNLPIIFNDTKVIKARIYGKKESGGRVELLLNSPLEKDLFLVYIRGRVKEKTRLLFDKGLEAEVVKLNPDGSREVRFFKDGRVLDFSSLVPVLDRIGHVPLPPYIKREDDEKDIEDYQTLFAKKEGAVAAPTASLHFTKELLKELEKNHRFYFVTLHVGAGTFKPVEVSDISKHVMHSEIYEIPKKTADLLESKEEILAVGTTVTRTVEYFARTKKTKGESDLFLNPLNPPVRVNYLLTNFHLPKSTLLMLVASFIGIEKTLSIYKEAIEKRYRFFSYGDAMLIV